MEYYYKEKKVTIPIWNGDLYLIDTNDDDELRKKHGIDLGYMPNAHAYRVSEKKKNGNVKEYDVLILNTSEKIFKNGYGTLCHESAHVANSILDKRGVHASFDNDEPFCYLQQHIFNEGAKFFFNFK